MNLFWYVIGSVGWGFEVMGLPSRVFLLFVCAYEISLVIQGLLVSPMYRAGNIWLPFLLMKNGLNTRSRKKNVYTLKVLHHRDMS